MLARTTRGARPESALNSVVAHAQTSTPPSWEDLSRRARALERSLTTAVHEFATLSSSIATHVSSPYRDPESGLADAEDVREVELARAILDQLRELHDIVAALAGHPRAAESRADSAFAKRMREIEEDHRREFQRSRSLVHDARERERLLGGGRRKGAATESGSDSRAISTLSHERSSLLDSLRTIDSVLDTAAATHSNLGEQRKSLASSGQGLEALMNRLPMANYLIRGIGNRQTRDRFILAFVIAVCMCFFLWWTVLRKW